MGFFDEYQDESGGKWLNADAKAELIESGQPVTIVSVGTEDTDRFGERYVLDVIIDGEEKALGFGMGTVDSRDRMLANMERYLDDPAAEKPVVKLTKVGRSQILVPYED